MSTGSRSTVTGPVGRIPGRGLCRPPVVILLMGGIMLAAVLSPPAAHADVEITVSNPGAARPGGTAGTVYLSDIVVKLKNGGSVKRTFDPPIPHNSLVRGSVHKETFAGIDVDDIEVTTFSQKVKRRDGTFGPEQLAPSLSPGRGPRQVAFLPSLDDPLGNALVLVTDLSQYQNPPDIGTLLSFANGLNPAEPDWFVATGFNEETGIASGPYTGSATVSDPELGVQFANVPEPSSILLFGAGAVVPLGCAWRRRKRAA